MAKRLTQPADDEKTQFPWHAEDVEAVLRELDTRREGLSDAEAARRLEQHGPNRLRPRSRQGPFMRFLLQFHNVLIYVLLVAAVAALALGELLDAGVILGVVIINALIGFIQEGKAEKALEAIGKMLSLEATVLREGQRREIPAEELVPGDVVLLREGDKVPADLRLFSVRDLRIDEAMLTGESVPVEKQTNPVEAGTPVADRLGLAFSATLVTSGKGSGVVIATGDTTEIGRISELVTETPQITTPLIRQMTQFGHKLAIVVLVISVATFLLGWLWRGQAPIEMAMAAVALAVAAIPEGLPAIMTITLAIGVQRMARRNAIIRRLPAVDTLGAITVICSDKTGTLTRNEMTVTSIATPAGLCEVEGVGYDPEGRVLADGQPAQLDQRPDLALALRAGLLCNDARLVHEDDLWRPQGDPMEAALIVLARKAGLDPDSEHEAWPTLDTIPFESKHKFMATLHRRPGGGELIFVKGAPEQILENCRAVWSDEGADPAPLDRAQWEQQYEQLAASGQRVLAAACKPAPGRDKIEHGDIQDLLLLGLWGIIDPPRAEAIESVRQCHEAGIRAKMITGDHKLTALAIGHQLAIGDGQSALTGRELEQIDEARLGELVHEIDVYARVSPEHKLRLVQALQAHGDVVAMTGDGGNDAPALKRADIGVAMGLKGTEVAQEASEMVLADDNFASIAHAVEEGRTVYDNLRKAVLFILPTNGGEAMVIMLAIVLGLTMPLTPVQVLWINMITAVTLALALAFEPPEANVMRRPPREPRQPLLTRFFLWRILLVSLIMFAGTFGVFAWLTTGGAEIELARTAAVNTIVLLEIFYLFNTRFILESSLSLKGFLGSRAALIAIALVIVFQLLFTYLGLMQNLFSTRPLDLGHWLLIIPVAASVLPIVEFEKWLMRRHALNHPKRQVGSPKR